jgi:hypothetical protein
LGQDDLHSDAYARRIREHGPARPHYDLRHSSRNFASTAGTLAGFALTVIVLLVTRTPDCTVAPVDPLCAGQIVRERAVVALLVAFFGCIVSAFLFPVISGEEVIAPRSHGMSLFTAGAFSIAVIFLFWSLSIVVDLFVGTVQGSVVHVADGLTIAVAVLAPAYGAYPIFDTKLAFDDPEREWLSVPVRDFIRLFAPAYALLVPATAIRLVIGDDLFASWVLHKPDVFHAIAWTAIVLIIINGLALLVLGGRRHSTRVGPDFGAGWVAVHALLFSLLVLMLPS